MKKGVLWKFNLRRTDLIRFALLYCFRDVEVYYDESCSLKAQKVLARTGNIFIGIRYRRIKLQLARVDQGVSLRERLEDVVSKISLESIEPLKKSFSENQCSFLRASISETVYEKAAFIIMAVFAAKRREHGVSWIEVAYDPWIVKYNKYAYGNLEVVFSGRFYHYIQRSVAYLVLLLSLSKKVLYEYGRYLRDLFDLNSKGPSQAAKGEKLAPSLLCQFYNSHAEGGLVYLWMMFVKKNDYRLVFDCEGPQGVVDRSARNFFNFIGAEFTEVGDVDGSLLQYFRRREIRHYVQLQIRFGFCWAQFLEEYFVYRIYFLEKVNRLNVRVVIQFRDTSKFQAVQAEVLEQTGGILLGFHWSNYVLSNDARYLNPHHVFFFWGRSNFLQARKYDVNIQYPLYSGLSVCTNSWHKNAVMGEVEREVEDFFRHNEGRKCVLLLDSSVDDRIHHGVRDLRKFYRDIFYFTLQKGNYTVLIKSKNFSKEQLEEFWTWPSLSRYYSLLVKQNRILIVPPTMQLYALLKYVDAAFCYGLNSAGVIAQCHGIPAVHWNCARHCNSGFVCNVSCSMTECLDMLAEILKGNVDKLALREVNHFGDLNGAQRIAYFIDTYIKYRECFLSDTSLAKSVENYKNKYGQGSCADI